MQPLDPTRLAIHRRAEQKYGLTPGLLDAVVGQESSGSTDLRKLGPVTRHGQAVGPFQIMEKFWGPVPSSYEGQADLSAMILSKGGVTPEEQLASYYGKGKPLPGHPTTDQYVQQTMQRIPVTPDMGHPDVYGGTVMPVSSPPAPVGTLPPVLAEPLPEAANIRPGPEQYLFALGDLLRPPAQRTGALKQLQGLLDPTTQAALQEKQMKNQLWQQQIGMDYLRLMGGQRMNPYQQAQADFWQASAANKAEANRIAAMRAEQAGLPVREERQPVNAQGLPVGPPISWAPGDLLPEGATTALKVGTARAPGVGSSTGWGDTSEGFGSAQETYDYLEKTIQMIEDDPGAVSFYSPARTFFGAIGGGVADLFGLPQEHWAREGVERWTGAQAKSAIDFRLGRAISQTARWIVNAKEDKRISNADFDQAQRILRREGLMKDSATTIAALRELQGVVGKAVPPAAGGATPPQASGTTPPQASGQGDIFEFSDLLPGGP